MKAHEHLRFGRNSLTARVGAGILVAFCLSGCSSNMFNRGAQGAAAGAVSASFLGAVTDLIVDGRVNTYRLSRNLAGGAVGGAVAGSAVGYQEDKQAAAQAPPSTNTEVDKEFLKLIGKENYQALVDLVNKQHADAYRTTQKTAKSSRQAYREAAFLLQALIDTDRKNPEGVTESLTAFVELNQETSDLAKARNGLGELHTQLLDERKALGIR